MRSSFRPTVALWASKGVKSRPWRTDSMDPRKGCTIYLKLKVMQRNSHKPEGGVMTGILGISYMCTGII